MFCDMQTEEILEKLREYKAEKADVYGIETSAKWMSYHLGQ